MRNGVIGSTADSDSVSRGSSPFSVAGNLRRACSLFYRSVAQLGRALRSGRRSRRFKSCHSDFGWVPQNPWLRVLWYFFARYARQATAVPARADIRRATDSERLCREDFHKPENSPLLKAVFMQINLLDVLKELTLNELIEVYKTSCDKEIEKLTDGIMWEIFLVRSWLFW